MPQRKKIIETFTLQFMTEEWTSFLFEDVLHSKCVVDKEIRVKGKYLSLRILEKNPTYTVGLVVNSKRDNIPPKTVGKKVEKLGLNDGDGLGYANVFIFEHRRRILMYEVNKNGCYVDQFIEYLYKCAKGEDNDLGLFEATLQPVMNFGSLEHVLGMSSYKSIEFEIASPNQLIAEYEHKNDAIEKAVKSGKTLHSDRITVKYEVNLRGQAKHEHRSLANKPLSVLLDDLLWIHKMSKENIKKIKVVGYAQDDDTRLSPIDLIADRYKAEITLDEPRENVDLLEVQRKSEIISLYNKCRKDFDKMFKA